MGERILVTGPARSGKSERAEGWAIASQQPVIYVATAIAETTDAEWQARLQAHQQRRPIHWKTREVPITLATTLQEGQPEECWLIDSLGTWLANGLDQPDEAWLVTVEELLGAIADFPGTLILVAEETGWGVVPAYPLGRLFRDRLGSLTRQVGLLCDRVELVVAGYAIDVRAIGIAIPCLEP
jgi:adenosylcobinamide kinase/adenosylcobinamide-phosphate guanylyltransferase